MIVEKKCEIVDIISTSHECVLNILNKHLHIKKLSERLIPCLMVMDEKHISIDIFKEVLDRFQSNPVDFLCRIVAVV